MTKQIPSIYRDVLGIATGDIVTTSYNSGPYIVKQITGPYYFQKTYGYLTIWPYPIISLTLSYTDTSITATAYINNIHREPDGRYFTDSRDEVFLQKSAQLASAQLPLFAPAASPEYSYQPGVDYRAGDSHIWHCPDCGKDFNAEKQNKHCGPACPYCNTRFPPIAIPIIMMGKPDIDLSAPSPLVNLLSDYVRALNT